MLPAGDVELACRDPLAPADSDPDARARRLRGWGWRCSGGGCVQTLLLGRGSMLHNPSVKINHHNSWCLQTKQYYTHAKPRGNTRHKVKHLGKSLEFVKLYTCA